ncbi:hypothetical protein [Francisella marina]|uniref:Uncharacterized protein n=1 Tax=Francisella marina TaxID=2249302 RepID=A0ABX5ZH77_9GAMM|nr:hypothetical protein [Francisella marina]QEO57600.1 hypothetical protein F0R74_06935 [Francisella marina]QEO58285.1 hypothetical protein F0R75_00305 [Francisella marina]
MNKEDIVLYKKLNDELEERCDEVYKSINFNVIKKLDSIDNAELQQRVKNKLSYFEYFYDYTYIEDIEEEHIYLRLEKSHDIDNEHGNIRLPISFIVSNDEKEIENFVEDKFKKIFDKLKIEDENKTSPRDRRYQKYLELKKEFENI